MRVDDRIAVSKFAGILHLHGYLAEVLYEEFADESGVPACSASDDDDAPRVDEMLSVVDDGRQHNVVSFYVDASSHAVFEAVGLFEYFLQHEVWETALLYL